MCQLYADDKLISLFLCSPDSPLPQSLLVLYILLGVVAGALVLCWCCWSPGWFVWRVSICRFLPCCNSMCASCQLCTRSCANSKEHRLAKVTPHTPANGSSAGAAALTHSADENVNMSAVWGTSKCLAARHGQTPFQWWRITDRVVAYNCDHGPTVVVALPYARFNCDRTFHVCFLLFFNGQAGCSVSVGSISCESLCRSGWIVWETCQEQWKGQCEYQNWKMNVSSQWSSLIAKSFPLKIPFKSTMDHELTNYLAEQTNVGPT